MNKIIIQLLIALPFSAANASFFQTDCSNGDASVSISTGHSKNAITVTAYDRASKTGKTKIKLSYLDIKIAYPTSIAVDQMKHSSCQEGDSYGVGTWKHLTYKRTVITKRDGSVFTANIIGLQKDKKTILAYLICEHNGNSQMMCTQD